MSNYVFINGQLANIQIEKILHKPAALMSACNWDEKKKQNKTKKNKKQKANKTKQTFKKCTFYTDQTLIIEQAQIDKHLKYASCKSILFQFILQNTKYCIFRLLTLSFAINKTLYLCTNEIGHYFKSIHKIQKSSPHLLVFHICVLFLISL